MHIVQGIPRVSQKLNIESLNLRHLSSKIMLGNSPSLSTHLNFCTFAESSDPSNWMCLPWYAKWFICSGGDTVKQPSVLLQTPPCLCPHLSTSFTLFEPRPRAKADELKVWRKKYSLIHSLARQCTLKQGIREGGPDSYSIWELNCTC